MQESFPQTLTNWWVYGTASCIPRRHNSEHGHQQENASKFHHHACMASAPMTRPCTLRWIHTYILWRNSFVISACTTAARFAWKRINSRRTPLREACSQLALRFDRHQKHVSASISLSRSGTKWPSYKWVWWDKMDVTAWNKCLATGHQWKIIISKGDQMDHIVPERQQNIEMWSPVNVACKWLEADNTLRILFREHWQTEISCVRDQNNIIYRTRYLFPSIWKCPALVSPLPDILVGATGVQDYCMAGSKAFGCQFSTKYLHRIHICYSMDVSKPCNLISYMLIPSRYLLLSLSHITLCIYILESPRYLLLYCITEGV